MFVHKEGSGKKNYFAIHGWAGNHKTFRRLMTYRPEDVTFYSIDLPGYGESLPPTRWSFDAIAQEVIVQLIALGGNEWTLVGNCGGALFALEIARQKSPLVKRLVLIDPFAYAPIYFRIFTWGQFGKYAYYSTFGNPLGRWMTNATLRQKRTKDTHLTSAFAKVKHQVVYKYICLLCGVRDASRFRGIDISTDIIYGQRTFKAVRKSLSVWSTLLPRVVFHELPNAGHEPIREATKELAEILFNTNSSRIGFERQAQ